LSPEELCFLWSLHDRSAQQALFCPQKKSNALNFEKIRGGARRRYYLFTLPTDEEKKPEAKKFSLHREEETLEITH
jgi:hypothetical protein